MSYSPPQIQSGDLAITILNNGDTSKWGILIVIKKLDKSVWSVYSIKLNRFTCFYEDNLVLL